MNEEQLRVLLLDDEASLREPLEKHLESNFGYQVDSAVSGKETLELMEAAQGRYDVALIDEVLQDGPDGIQVMLEIKERYPDVECIIFTGWGLDSALQALRAGAYRYLSKPFNVEELGMLIRMAAEHRKLRQELETTKREKEWLQTFLEIGKATTSVLEFDQVLEEICDQVGRLMDVSGLHVALYDEENQMLHFELCFDRGRKQDKWQRPFSADSGLMDWVIRNRQPLLLRDYPNDPVPIAPAQRHYGNESDQEVTKSWLGVPLAVKDQVIGAIAVQSYEAHRFGETDRQILATVASQVAIAIENARLFSELGETSRQLEGLIASSFDAVVAIDKDKHITVFNKQAENMLGYRAEEMLGHTVARLHRDREEAGKIHDMVSREGAVSNYEMILQDREGKEIPIHLSAVSIRDARRVEIGQAGFMRDLRRTRALEDRLHALVQMGQILSSTLDLDRVLQLVVESAVAASPNAQKGALHLYDEKTGTLHIKASVGYSPDVVEATTLKIGEGRAGWVCEHAAPLVVDNVPEDPMSKVIDHPESYEQKSSVCVPIIVGHKAIGSLSLDSVNMFHAFGPEDLGLLSSLASQASIAIVNARLFEEVQNGLARLRSVYEASSQIISTLDPDQALQFIVDKVRETMEAWRASVLLVDEAGYPQRLVAVGFDKDLKADTSIRPGGISREVMRTGTPRFIEDTTLEADRVHPQMIADGARAAACLPFALQAKPIGVMWIHYREPRRFSEAEKETLRLYANQTAIAYDNARRMRELEHMRRAAEAMAGALEPAQVLQEIVESAREVSLADSSAIWSYDDVHNQFIPEELAASGIPRDKLEKFRKSAPKKGGTADTVMDLGWVGITDVHDARYGFMGPSTLELLDEIGVKSVQGIVLKAGDEKLGVLYANYNRPKSFTDADRRTLETFAYHASLALKKTRLLKQVGKARNAAKVVAEVSTLGDLRHTLDSVVKGMQEALGSDAVILYTYDQEQQDFGLPPIMAGVLYRREVLELGWIAKQSVVHNILALGELHVAEDTPSDPLMRGPFVSREGILSSVGIPLRVEDRKVGVMFVNYRSPHRFTEDELTNVQLFANQAAVAIWNAQLYQAEQQRVKELAGLNSISQTIRSLTDIQQVYRQVNESVAQLAGAEMCAVLLYDDKGEELVCQLPMYGVPDEIGRRYHIPVAQGSPTGVMWEMQDYLILNEVERYPLVGELGLTHLAQEAGLRDTLLVKLTAGNRNIGVIQASNKLDGTAFSEDDARLLCIFAGQAAAVIENARLYEELKHSKGIIGTRTALAWMGMASSTWRHTIDKHAMTIREQAHFLRQDWAQASTSRQGTKVSRRVDTIERLATQILEKPITPPLSTEAGLEPVSLSALISERARQLWQNDPYKPVRLRLDLQLHDSATARVSPEWLRRAFDMLVDNAVEAVSGREIQEITVGTRASRGGLEIFVSDTGPGIPEETRAKIGLEIIEKPEDAEGLGMGLLMAQTIVQTYGGEIRVESTGPMGTTMVIWLPSEE